MSESDKTITVELEDGRMFEVDPSAADLGAEARTLLSGGSVTENRGGESFTVHPVHKVKAIHVGEVPRAGFGQRAKYRM